MTWVEFSTTRMCKVLIKFLEALLGLFKAFGKKEDPPPNAEQPKEHVDTLPPPIHEEVKPKPPAQKPAAIPGSIQWYEEKLATVQLNDSPEIAAAVQKAIANKARYQFVSEKTGVPWDLIAAIHHMEASFNFNGVLHNGEKIIGTGKKTTLVPAGRGPFASWEDAAIDALKYEGFAWLGGWSLPMKLQKAEKYNGLGYLKKGLMSPYVWSMTNLYLKGLYVADGKFDPEAKSKRPGVASILVGIQKAGHS